MNAQRVPDIRVNEGNCSPRIRGDEDGSSGECSLESLES
jgi:hypothetical protein